ncbi:MAG: iron-containing alcohol dehydrogenase [Rhodoplanes sp.]|uniref:iron-containing alcohol dehydrogenase family protein n=1 Tax=Rhodoplanes sp. TaxID=1968906 RepID=UPI00181E594B|nr:iron-containing alcohol dehydrogenase family protein [Rhodoplanes sp.]NVO15310.1 iron-containing alcohol dehydrogenase [Rhodoplanes sp.]
MLEAHFPKRIVYGQGSIRFLETLDAERVYLLVDEVFHQHNAALFADLDALFAARGSRTMLQFGEGHEPTLDFAKQISGRLRAFAPDLILAIGGGSILDTAKVLEVFYEHPDITDQALYDRFHLPPIRRKAKLVAVPTTSGSGSEVTPFSVMYVASGNPSIPSIKRGIADYQFIPDHVILDPAFTLTMPLGVTAATGLDAFVHAMEAFVSVKPKNLFGDHFALEGMRRVHRFLPLVLKQPDNLDYRSQMQIAATMGGLALANRSSGGSHAVGKQLATLCPLAHGLSVSIMLPDVIRANAVVRAPEYAEIARYLGSEATDEQAAIADLIGMIDGLLTAARCPRTLADLRLDKQTLVDHADLLAQNSLADAAMKGNPRVLSHDEVKQMFLNLA